jgi:hypothetical protein
MGFESGSAWRLIDWRGRRGRGALLDRIGARIDPDAP